MSPLINFLLAMAALVVACGFSAWLAQALFKIEIPT